MRLLRWLWLLSLGLGGQIGQAQQLAWERPMEFIPLAGKVFGYVHQLSNGDYLVSGAGTAPVRYPFIYARVQADGTVVYQRTGRTLATLEQDVAPLGDGAALLVASVPARSPLGYGTSKLFCQRLQATGDTLPGVSQPVSVLNGYPTRVVREGDSLRVLAFHMNDALQGSPGEFALLATDTLGQVGRVRHYPNPIGANAYPCDLVRTARGGWLLVGELAGAPYSHPYLVETDAQGRLLRQRHPLLFAGSTEERVRRSFNNLIRLRDGSGYVFSGWQQTGGQTWSFVAKVDTELNVVWTYRHPPQATTFLYSSRVYELTDGSLLLLAADSQVPGGSVPPPLFYLIHVSAGGQLLGQQAVGSAGCSKLVLYSWQPLAGGSLLLVGGGGTCTVTGSANAAYVARLDQALPLATARPAAGGAGVARLWPNPAGAGEGASWQGAVPAGARRAGLVLLDALGREVRRVAVAARGAEVRQAVPVAGLAPGAYTVRLLLDELPWGPVGRLLVAP